MRFHSILKPLILILSLNLIFGGIAFIFDLHWAVSFLVGLIIGHSCFRISMSLGWIKYE